MLSNVTFISLVPVVFLALRGLGSFGGGSPSFEQTMVYFTGLAALGFEAIVENDNAAPWHEIQQPLLLKGLRIGPTLVEISTALIAHAVIDGLPWWKKPIVLILLLAPLTYPILVQGLHRLQVKEMMPTESDSDVRRNGQGIAIMRCRCPTYAAPNLHPTYRSNSNALSMRHNERRRNAPGSRHRQKARKRFLSKCTGQSPQGYSARQQCCCSVAMLSSRVRL